MYLVRMCVSGLLYIMYLNAVYIYTCRQAGFKTVPVIKITSD